MWPRTGVILGRCGNNSLGFVSDIVVDCRNIISFDVDALTLSSVVDCDKPDCMVVVSTDSCWFCWSCCVVHKDAFVVAAFGSKARFRIYKWNELRNEMNDTNFHIQLMTNQFLDYAVVLKLDLCFYFLKTFFVFFSTLLVPRNLI